MSIMQVISQNRVHDYDDLLRSTDRIDCRFSLPASRVVDPYACSKYRPPNSNIYNAIWCPPQSCTTTARCAIPPIDHSTSNPIPSASHTACPPSQDPLHHLPHAPYRFQFNVRSCRQSPARPTEFSPSASLPPPGFEPSSRVAPPASID